jgi:hypothetical protein
MHSDDVKLEFRIPVGIKALLAKTAAAKDRSMESMARQLISRGLMGLMEPLTPAEASTFGAAAVRSPVTGLPYQDGPGSVSHEAQDRVALAAAAAGRPLSHFEASRIVNADPVDNAAAAATASIEDLVK